MSSMNQAMSQSEVDQVRKVFGMGPETVSQGISCLAACFNAVRPNLGFSVEELDSIVEGIHLESLVDEAYTGWYLDGFLAAVGWWAEVCRSVAFGDRAEDEKMSAHDLQQQAKAAALLSDTLEAFPRAFFSADESERSDASDKAHMQLLKSYRLFTRHICQWAEEVWPELNLRPLFQKPFAPDTYSV